MGREKGEKGEEEGSEGGGRRDYKTPLYPI